MGKKLGEMVSGLKVHLTATAGLEQLEFETSVVQAGEGHIIVEPIKHNDKILNFSNSSIIKNVIIDSEPLPEKYINVDVETTVFQNKKYHMILSDKEGTPINRRNEFRVYVGSYVTAQIANTNQSVEVILKDVSVGGFSLIIRKEGIDGIVGWKGQAIKAVYYRENNKNRIPMVFIGQVVREEDVDEGRILVGCKNLRQPFGIEKFVAEMQREELRRKSGSSGDSNNE